MVQSKKFLNTINSFLQNETEHIIYARILLKFSYSLEIQITNSCMPPKY